MKCTKLTVDGNFTSVRTAEKKADAKAIITSVVIGATNLRHYFDFVVPFFLATSIYLTISNLYITGEPYYLKSRVLRLLIPYIFWSIVYIFARAINCWIAHQPEKINQILEDPLAIIFFGGASFQLYYLLLLLVAAILIPLADFLIRKKINLKYIILIFIASLILYQINLISGNSFILSNNVAFNNFFPIVNKNSLMRLVLVEFSWILRCLPYVFAAIILTYSSINKNLFKLEYISTIVYGRGFLFLDTLGKIWISSALCEIGVVYSSLLFAISVSKHLQGNRIITSLGVCSFGIYLIHIIFLNFFRTITHIIYPEVLTEITVLSILITATPTFLVSWIATYILMKNKSLSKLMFGI